MIREKSAGAIIFHKNKVRKYLLLKYSGKKRDYWDFVKGNIEKGEDDKATIKREIKEETGLEAVKFISGFKERIHFFYSHEKKLVSKEVVFYLLKANESKVKISWEHIDFTWLPYVESVKKATFENAKTVLKKAESFLKKGLSNYK